MAVDFNRGRKFLDEQHGWAWHTLSSRQETGPYHTSTDGRHLDQALGYWTNFWICARYGIGEIWSNGTQMGKKYFNARLNFALCWDA